MTALVIAPNCFRGTATAAAVADGLAAGARRVIPADGIRIASGADGGDGTLDVVEAHLGGRRRSVRVVDAIGRQVSGSWLDLGDRALIEAADSCGLTRLGHAPLRPMRSGSGGVGLTVADAVAARHRELLLGLGGTAVVDGGAGALAALGARFLDARGAELVPHPSALEDVVRVDLGPAQRLLAGVRLRFLADVDTPLLANGEHYGVQKGLRPSDLPVVRRALGHLVTVLANASPVGGAAALRERAVAPWWGAGGGIGVGLSAVATTRSGSGANILLETLGLADDIRRARLVITGEGAVDATTWHGKLPGTIAAIRSAAGMPTVIATARVRGDSPSSLVTCRPLPTAMLPVPVAGRRLHTALATVAQRACAEVFGFRGGVM